MGGWNKDKRMYSDEETFCKGADISHQRLRKYYKERKETIHECSNCGINEWLGNELDLELHHKNGDNQDNRLDNLMWLCPNCHSQTPNFKGSNGTGNKKVEDEKIIEAINNSKNVRQVLKKVGLRPRGGNYNRVYRVMAKNNLSLPEKKDNVCIECKTKIDKKAKRCVRCSSLKQRKIYYRPDKEDLLREIKETNYCAVGRKYGVSDNAIRKWLK